MTSKHAFESVDRLFRDMYNRNETFGCKIMIVSVDFRQTLPVVRHGPKTQIVENCIKKSYLCPKFEIYRLKDNRRIYDNDNRFKEWLIKVSDGIGSSKFEKDHECIKIPKNLLLSGNLVTHIFDEVINVNNAEHENSHSKIILAPKNVDVSFMNEQILDRMTGET